MLRNVIGGGKSLGFTFLLFLALTAFAACSEDSPATPNNDTRTIAADSTGGLAINLKGDTAWADTIDVHFGDDTTTTVTIAVPDSIKTMSAEFAASRRQ